MSNKLKFNYVLSEEDFYPPSDDRVLQSNIVDINSGDNFETFAKYMFTLYEEEEYYEN